MQRFLPPFASLLVLVFAACGDDDGPSPDAGRDASSPDAAVVDAGPLCTSDDDCNDTLHCNGVERCLPAAPGADARGCFSLGTPCNERQICDEAMRRCVTSCAIARDADEDGHDAEECGGDDCDDSDPQRFPGNPEVCEAGNVDEDCDETTFGFRDADMDGAADAACCNGLPGLTTCGTDCDDAASGVHPSQADLCNERDDDCDGEIDEDSPPRSYFPDCDGDGFGLTGATGAMGCLPAGPPAECAGALTATWSPNAEDCDDTRAGVHPTALEICDGLDDDCNGTFGGLGEDDDADGHADGTCGGDDCDDTCPTCYPGAGAELCDGRDQDCVGGIDDGVDPGLMTTYYRDVDADGVGDPATARLVCVSPGADWVTAGDDCNDGERLTGACVAPLHCVMPEQVCGCQASIRNNADYLDLENGTTSLPSSPAGGRDIEDRNGAFAMQHLSGFTSVRYRRLAGVPYPAVDDRYLTGLTLLGEDPDVWAYDTIFVLRTSVGNHYKLAFGTYSGGMMHFTYAPIGPAPAGFACMR